jgi:hypothetical protein
MLQILMLEGRKNCLCTLATIIKIVRSLQKNLNELLILALVSGGWYASYSGHIEPSDVAHGTHLIEARASPGMALKRSPISQSVYSLSYSLTDNINEKYNSS